MVVFEIWGMRIAFFGLNLPGPANDDPAACSRREAQATVVQKLVRQELMDGMEVVVCGDLNDYDEQYPDQANHSPVSRVLGLLQDVDGNGVDDLTNVVSLLDSSQRYTVWCARVSCRCARNI
jgi:hypothetical protein